LSIIPNDSLKPAQSLELITYGLPEKMVTSPYVKDFYNTQIGFWSKVVIRNLQTSFNCSYRVLKDEALIPLPPLSERPLYGWGSYLEVVTSDPAPDIEIDYTGVTYANAILRKKNG